MKNPIKIVSISIASVLIVLIIVLIILAGRSDNYNTLIAIATPSEGFDVPITDEITFYGDRVVSATSTMEFENQEDAEQFAEFVEDLKLYGYIYGITNISHSGNNVVFTFTGSGYLDRLSWDPDATRGDVIEALVTERIYN